ncbi:MAG TPA: hypothetical protein VKA89_11315 [Solirubrobacterales bacterium]|nr:hypothetical protein [Solirubrobacterales bacterium]
MEEREDDATSKRGDDTPADEPGPSDPSPASVPSEQDVEEDLPGVPEEAGGGDQSEREA